MCACAAASAAAISPRVGKHGHGHHHPPSPFCPNPGSGAPDLPTGYNNKNWARRDRADPDRRRSSRARRASVSARWGKGHLITISDRRRHGHMMGHVHRGEEVLTRQGHPCLLLHPPQDIGHAVSRGCGRHICALPSGSWILAKNLTSIMTSQSSSLPIYRYPW